MGDGGGGQWLVRMEWHLAGRSVCLPLLIFLCTIKSRSSILALAHSGGPGKRAVKRLWCGWCGGELVIIFMLIISSSSNGCCCCFVVVWLIRWMDVDSLSNDR